MKQLGFFIAASVIFHFLVTTSALYFADRAALADKKAEVTQIDILDDKDNELQKKLDETRQLIKQLKTTVRKIQAPNIKARFESEETQRVAKETKARNLGATKNSDAQHAFLPQEQPVQVPTPPQQTTPKEKGDLPEFARVRPMASPQMPVAAESAVSSMLPNDVENSNATNLNTDANVYYSFYNRVQELFYVRWVERVNYYWDRISPDYKRKVLVGHTWSTQVEIWLKASGEFHSAYIIKSSGYQPFDEAAVFAFKDAKFFPNPPKAKVESDGFVRLRYRFNILVSAY